MKNKPQLPNFHDIWNYRKPKETEEKFKALIPLAKEQNNEAYHAELLAHLARSISLQQRYADAQEVLDQAKMLVSAPLNHQISAPLNHQISAPLNHQISAPLNHLVADEMGAAAAYYHLEQGRLLFWQKDRVNALSHFEKAYELSIQHKEDFIAIDTMHMLAICNEKMEESIAWHVKGLELAETTSCARSKKWIGSLNSNQAINYRNMGDYANSILHFQKALAYGESQGKEISVCMANYAIAEVYRLDKKPEMALQILKKIIEKVDEGTLEAFGHFYLDSAECLLDLDRKEEAKPYFARAYDLLKDFEWDQTRVFWGGRREQEELDRMKALSV